MTNMVQYIVHPYDRPPIADVAQAHLFSVFVSSVVTVKITDALYIYVLGESNVFVTDVWLNCGNIIDWICWFVCHHERFSRTVFIAWYRLWNCPNGLWLWFGNYYNLCMC